MNTLGIWIGAFLTLGILSFLYKDNPFYKLSEAIFLGISAGYWFVSLFWQNLVPKLFDNLGITKVLGFSAEDGALQNIFVHGKYDPNIWYLIAGVLGVMMLMRLIPRIGWISRWPLAFIVGTTSGVYLTRYLASNALAQIENSLKNFIILGQPGFLSWANLNTLIILIGVITGLAYFYFSKEHKGAFGGAAKIGIYFLMVTFGASFGYTVMSRMSLLIGRLDFLYSDWLKLIQ
ncbi:MAG: hypothetical protein DRP26_04200 [Candidatus Zixiibacteriota bacterium]|nr:MAG: hypothetical protein DRP26_04200 [candidate division Zixibacteria bacterium]